MKVYLAADHAGVELKKALVTYVQSLGYETEDCGAFAYDANDDYPDFIKIAAEKLSQDAAMGSGSRAIVIGASGQGEAICANRFSGVRCALYYGSPAKSQTDMGGNTLDMIASVRSHNDANALSLGARFLSEEEAKDGVKKFLESPFPGEARHMRRIAKIDL